MLAFDQDTWTTEQEIPTQARRQSGTDELDRERLSRAATPDPDDDDLEDDEELDLDDDDELELDDDDLEDDDLDADVVPDYDEEDDLDDDDDTVDDPLRASLDEDEEIFDEDGTTDPDEIPEREEADNEDLGYPSEQEVSRPQEGSDTNFSEQIDVTPPTPHEFPSVGSPKTDFTSRNAGRTTGRMVGHEPGTEGI
jgi:hypothetical protein